MNQAVIDEIVANVLAQLQPVAVRPVKPAPPAVAASNAVTPNVATVNSSTSVAAQPVTPKLNVAELIVPVITADLLENSVRPGQTLRIGRTSILTPSARDWLNSHKTAWSRQDRSAGANGSKTAGRANWQIILQTVTPSVRALHDGLRRLAEGWKIELVGLPLEAAALAISRISTADCDGVVIFTEQAELIACKANRNDRVRAAVIQNNKQWEQVMRTLSANVVCISPIGRTFIELRNLLRDCAGTRPSAPAGM